MADLMFLPESQHCLALPWSYLQVEVSQLPNIKSPIHPNVFSSFPIAASDRVRRESDKIILKFVILRILCFTDDTLPTLFLIKQLNRGLGFPGKYYLGKTGDQQKKKEYRISISSYCFKNENIFYENIFYSTMISEG